MKPTRMFSLTAAALNVFCAWLHAQPVFTHTHTVEYVANNAGVVVLGRVVKLEEARSSYATIATIDVEETLKGAHRDSCRLTVGLPPEVVVEWKDKSRQVLVTTYDGKEALTVIDLGSDELAVLTADFALLRRPEDVIRCFREAIRRSPGVTRTLSVGLHVPSEITKRVKDWSVCHGVIATVPVDEALENVARKYVLSDDLQTRRDGVEWLRYFRSEENVARAKELLSDSGTSVLHDAEHNKGVEVRIYLVRQAAYETLAYWGFEVEKPLIREEIRREAEKKSGGPDAADAKPTAKTSARDDNLTADSATNPEMADKVYRGVDSIRNGNHYAEAVHVDVSDEEYPSKVMGMFRIMPKVETIIVAGPRYTDWHLERLAELAALRTLVLDSTDITDAAIERLRRARPELAVYRSQRWAIEKLHSLATELYVESRGIAHFESPEVRRLRAILGDKHFVEATAIDFGRLPDTENGPGDMIQNEELLPIKYLTTVTKVDLSYSRPNDAGMHYLKQHTKVTELDLPLGEVTAKGMTQLASMTEVESFHGTLTDDKMPALAGFKKLKNLVSYGGPVSDAGLRHLADLKDLRLIWLSGTNILGPGLAHLADKPNLRSLTIKESKLENLAAIPVLPGLESLHLEKTQIDDASLAQLAKCESLETLWLTDTPITDAGISHLKQLQNLRDVNLDGTKITDAALSELSQIAGLAHLNLSGTAITNSGLRTLREFPKLRKVYLYHVSIDAEGNDILRGLKGIEIVPRPTDEAHAQGAANVP